MKNFELYQSIEMIRLYIIMIIYDIAKFIDSLQIIKILKPIVSNCTKTIQKYYHPTTNIFNTYLFLGIFYVFHNTMNFLGRYRIINDRIDAEPYLERYYLFIKDREGIFANFPFNIMLHHFLKSDPDDLHDHPWPFCTIILRGGYWEHIVDEFDDNDNEKIKTTKRVWRGPGTIRFAKANELHRVELDENIDSTWTLFMPGKKIRDWGFVTKNGWENNVEYLKNKKKVFS